jgi:hypothetical protein
MTLREYIGTSGKALLRTTARLPGLAAQTVDVTLTATDTHPALEAHGWIGEDGEWNANENKPGRFEAFALRA